MVIEIVIRNYKVNAFMNHVSSTSRYDGYIEGDGILRVIKSF